MLAPGVGVGGCCRMAYTTEWARMMVYLATMQGLGKPGSNIWGTAAGAPTNDEFYFQDILRGYRRRCLNTERLITL